MADAERIAASLPENEPAPAPPPVAEPRTWRLGDRARSRSQGWEGRIAALERGGKRVTLEAGGLRVTVDPGDLEPAVGIEPAVPREETLAAIWPSERTLMAPGPAPREPARRRDRRGPGPASRSPSARPSGGGVGLERARTVASSLDLRGARVDEALELLDRYLDDAALAGLDRVTIVHGLGTGALRDAVRSSAAANPLVREVRPGERGEGGDGATIVSL